MRYDDPNLLDALAREYVVGTLHGRARDRFARVLTSSLAARRSVAEWERRLAPLARAAQPLEPPRAAWDNIEAALGMRRRTRAVGVWPAIAAGLAVIAIVIGGLYLTRTAVEAPRFVAVVAEDESGPVWLLQAFAEARELRVRTVNTRPEPVGSSYELWMLPGGGANPVSLGVISGVNDVLLMLNDQQLAILEQTATLAVSVEPLGGSPTGLPTGPVILTAPLLRA
jgi:anti-sigma-K factor RskA